MKLIILMTLLLLISACSHKIIAKNCDPTESGEYSVCDSVLFK